MFSHTTHKNGIDHVIFHGQYPVSKLNERLIDLSKQLKSKKKLAIALDLRFAVFDIAYEDLAPLAKSIIESCKDYQNILAAIIVEDRNLTALCYFFTFELEDSNITPKVFSSEFEALRWLRIFKKEQ